MTPNNLSDRTAIVVGASAALAAGSPPPSPRQAPR